MSIVVFVEQWNGAFKKASFEAVNYAAKWAEMSGTDVVAITANGANPEELGKYGATTVKTLDLANTAHGVAMQLAELSQGAEGLVIAGTSFGRSLAPAVTVKTNGSLSTNTTSTPLSTAPLQVNRGTFSAKGIQTVELTGFPVVCFVPNAIGYQENAGSAAVESASAAGNDLLETVEVNVATGKISLPEADIVVSAGRGLKGPENWGMIESLAEVLGAATACSKPVSDVGWRSHAEHVGQTGIQVNPNLYIAVGISGAIQHLAGVSASKTIVVVNTDPEAPFFKAADYGVVGDAFDVIPKLTESLKAHKANQ